MPKKDSKLFTIYKTTTDKIIESGLVINDKNFEAGETVAISNNQVFHKILDYYKSSDKKHITKL